MNGNPIPRGGAVSSWGLSVEDRRAVQAGQAVQPSSPKKTTPVGQPSAGRAAPAPSTPPLPEAGTAGQAAPLGQPLPAPQAAPLGQPLPALQAAPLGQPLPALQAGPLGQPLPSAKTGAANAASQTEGCQTCENRKYQDGSGDPGVSFKTPTKMSPDQAATAVRGHEMEHVTRNRAEAQRENRKVVSQSVTYHTAICPDCGQTYVSGGTTRTTTKAVQQQPAPQRSGGFEAYG